MNCARQVTAITAKYSTLVEDDQLVFGQRLRRRTGMRPTRAHSGGDDRLERGARAPLELDFVFNFSRQLQLRNTGANPWDDLIHYAADKESRVAHGREFSGRLDGAEAFDRGGVVEPAEAFAQAGVDGIALDGG